MLDLGNLRIGITVDSNEAKNNLGGFLEQLKNGEVDWAKFAKGATMATAAAAAAVGAFAVKAVNDFMKVADGIDKSSQKLGISAEAYQEWDYVMGHAGMDIDSFGRSMRTMQKNVLDGSKAFDALGIATKDSEGNFRSQEEIMNETILQLADMEDITQRNALAQEIFGNQYTEMLPLLNSGREAIEEQIQAAHDLNLVIDGDAVSAGAHLQDTIDDIKASFGMIITQIAIQLLPVVQEVADFVIAHMPEIQMVINAIVSVIGTLIGIVGTLVGKVLEIVPAFVEAITTAWNNVVGFVEDVKGIGSDLWNAGKDAIDNFLGGIKSAWESVVGWVEEKVQWVKDKFSGIGNIINGATQGSHRTGLREVPYDGYIAELHKGEMVLTAAEANAYQNRATGTQSVSNITVNNYSPKALTEAETARQFRKTQRRLELGFGG